MWIIINFEKHEFIKWSADLDPLENLVNFITGDAVMFPVAQVILVFFVLLSFIAGRRTGTGSHQTETEVSPGAHRISSNTMMASLYAVSVVFFISVCFIAEEIAGHRIFWLGLDLSLLTYLFFFNKWFKKKLSL